MQEYIQAGNYKCPLCKKSVENINWLPLENLISQQPMPDEYKKKVNLVCNDCEKKTTEADYHFLGCKCGHCGSYNTALS
jgi:RING finger/CHY zinc finger protein 1